MKEKELTAYCGLYCADCIHFRNSHSKLAEQLKAELEKADFQSYAGVRSPFGSEFQHYDSFMEVLEALIRHSCKEGCRVGGGCGKEPCPVIMCCQEKEYEGCWECGEFESCEKFEFLKPRCGNAVMHNLKEIRECGLEGWSRRRSPFYNWRTARPEELPDQNNCRIPKSNACVGLL